MNEPVDPRRLVLEARADQLEATVRNLSERMNRIFLRNERFRRRLKDVRKLIRHIDRNGKSKLAVKLSTKLSTTAAALREVCTHVALLVETAGSDFVGLENMRIVLNDAPKLGDALESIAGRLGPHE